ncbi:MAG: hypothetical protein AAFO94_23050 [Bacteroidota bacterium]
MDKKPKDGLEKLLQQSFSKYSEAPSPMLWDQIEAGLKEDRKKRIAFYWPLLVAASIALAAVLWIPPFFDQTNKEASISASAPTLTQINRQRSSSIVPNNMLSFAASATKTTHLTKVEVKKSNAVKTRITPSPTTTRIQKPIQNLSISKALPTQTQTIFLIHPSVFCPFDES